MNSPFHNQIVWITGASSGIGEAMAKDFVKRGAKVILTARRVERLQALAHALNSGSQIRIFECVSLNLIQKIFLNFVSISRSSKSAPLRPNFITSFSERWSYNEASLSSGLREC